MKKENKKHPGMVRVESEGTVTPEIETELKALAALPDDDIDTSDIPGITDWSGAERGKFYRPIKEAVTVRLDADVLHWLKKDGKECQNRLNAILRKEMEMAAQSKGRYAGARQRQISLMSEGIDLGTSGSAPCPREELHERALQSSQSREEEGPLFGPIEEEFDNHPCNGNRGIWRVDGVRHSCLISRVSTAREARDRAIAEGAVHEWELSGIEFLGELPEVFRF